VGYYREREDGTWLWAAIVASYDHDVACCEKSHGRRVPRGRARN
jgi:hypothetical protein